MNLEEFSSYCVCLFWCSLLSASSLLLLCEFYYVAFYKVLSYVSQCRYMYKGIVLTMLQVNVAPSNYSLKLLLCCPLLPFFPGHLL